MTMMNENYHLRYVCLTTGLFFEYQTTRGFVIAISNLEREGKTQILYLKELQKNDQIQNN
jgi:hypothetical protein